MKSTLLMSMLALAAGVFAQAPAATTTITASPGCPTAPPADVVVTRSAVAVPSCEAGGNGTKPSIVSMSMPGSGAGAGGAGNATGTGTGTGTGQPAQFTGGAVRGQRQQGIVAGIVVGGVVGAVGWVL
ncbi:hypothetical protein SVAN01_02057 [Stagonosporopsis vannaccii]|nr:hypothetical protein SVAN01_02057 [Stagonosporopsis vannaccii]